MREQGFSTLWLEFDASEKRQRGLDTLKRIENLTEDQVKGWVPAKYNKEVFADAIMRARDAGMEIGLLDDKASLNALKKEHPEFVEIQKQYTDLRAQGLSEVLAMEQALIGLSSDEVEQISWP